MAAPTSTYVDFGTGNDFKGTTFTDGAYTQATKNLLKVGAFTASQVGHWLKISGTHITTGYYKIATKTDNDNVILATDASSDGSDSSDVTCTQADGTTSKPWRSVQGALDLITRDATNGDQINVKAGTAQVLGGSLSLVTYGSPGNTTPLILRGYTSAAGDGGIGEIDCGGNSMWAGDYRYLIMADLDCHNFGDNVGINLSGYSENLLFRCAVHKGASTPSSKALVFVSRVIGCHIYDAGTGGRGISGYASSFAYKNYVHDCSIGINAIGAIFDNLVVNCGTPIIVATDGIGAYNNTIRTSAAGTAAGLDVRARTSALNNFIEGYSGSGGKGLLTAETWLIGYNGFYNNATNESLGDTWIDLGNDATPASSPFTDAAAGDFSLNTAVAGAIDGAYPGAWPGLATTVDHADIGAVQNGAGTSSGGAAVRILPIGKVGL